MAVDVAPFGELEECVRTPTIVGQLEDVFEELVRKTKKRRDYVRVGGGGDGSFFVRCSAFSMKARPLSYALTFDGRRIGGQASQLVRLLVRHGSNSFSCDDSLAKLIKVR